MIQHQQWYDAQRVIVVDERNHGTVQMCIPAPNYEESRLEGKADALIYALWVDEPYRGQGGATYMLEATVYEVAALHLVAVGSKHLGDVSLTAARLKYHVVELFQSAEPFGSRRFGGVIVLMLAFVVGVVAGTERFEYRGMIACPVFLHIFFFFMFVYLPLGSANHPIDPRKYLHPR